MAGDHVGQLDCDGNQGGPWDHNVDDCNWVEEIPRVRRSAALSSV